MHACKSKLKKNAEKRLPSQCSARPVQWLGLALARRKRCGALYSEPTRDSRVEQWDPELQFAPFAQPVDAVCGREDASQPMLNVYTHQTPKQSWVWQTLEGESASQWPASEGTQHRQVGRAHVQAWNYPIGAWSRKRRPNMTGPKPRTLGVDRDGVRCHFHPQHCISPVSRMPMRPGNPSLTHTKPPQKTAI